QSVSQKWGELAASVVRLLRGARRLDDLNEGSSGLQLGLAVIVETAGPGRPFAIGENRPRHLEFSKLVGKRNQSLRSGLSLRQPVQAVGEREERVERSKPLRLHDGAHAVSQQLPHLPAIGAGLLGSRKQGDQLIFRDSRGAGRVVNDLG